MVLASIRRRCALSLAKAISVGGVEQQQKEPSAALLADGGSPGALVAGEVIEDHDIAGLERGRELRLDPGLEDPKGARAFSR